MDIMFVQAMLHKETVHYSVNLIFLFKGFYIHMKVLLCLFYKQFCLNVSLYLKYCFNSLRCFVGINKLTSLYPVSCLEEPMIVEC